MRPIFRFLARRCQRKPHAWQRQNASCGPQGIEQQTVNIAEITTRMHAIRDHNQWKPFHSPKNLTMAASVEMAELVEIFQWLTEAQSHQPSPEQREHAGQEIADVILYLTLLCAELGLDMQEVVLAKLADNERRFLSDA